MTRTITVEESLSKCLARPNSWGEEPDVKFFEIDGHDFLRIIEAPLRAKCGTLKLLRTIIISSQKGRCQ